MAFPDGRLVGLDAASGAVRWQNATGDSFANGPRGDDTGVFAVGESGTLYALRPPGGTGALPAASTSPTPTPPPATQTEAEREPTTQSTRRRPTRPTRTSTYRSTKPSPSESTTTPPTTPPTTETAETAPSGA